MCSRLPHSQRQSCSSTWGALGIVEGGCYGAQEAKPGVGFTELLSPRGQDELPPCP